MLNIIHLLSNFPDTIILNYQTHKLFAFICAFIAKNLR
jgi:hypothetical protein